MEVSKVAAEGVTRREAAPQRILVLAQHEDAARWQRVAGAQTPRPGAPPPVGEQRPAPAQLLPRGAHVVPVAIRAEGSAEGRVMPAYHERQVHSAARLGEGAQLQRVGQRWHREGEERGRVRRGGVPLHVGARRQRPQRRQGLPKPRCPVRRPLTEPQRRSGVSACGDTRAANSVYPAAHTVLQVMTLCAAVGPLLGLGCLPLSGREKWGLQCPAQGSALYFQPRTREPEMQCRLPMGSIRKDCPSGVPSHGHQSLPYPTPISQTLAPLTPLRGSSQRALSLAHPDGVGQPGSKDPIWRWQYQVAKPLLTGLLGLPPAQPLPRELAHLVGGLHYFSGGQWSCRVRGGPVWENGVWASDPCGMGGMGGMGRVKDTGLGVIWG